jgi:hypothetical protein
MQKPHQADQKRAVVWTERVLPLVVLYSLYHNRIRGTKPVDRQNSLAGGASLAAGKKSRLTGESETSKNRRVNVPYDVRSLFQFICRVGQASAWQTMVGSLAVSPIIRARVKFNAEGGTQNMLIVDARIK